MALRDEIKSFVKESPMPVLAVPTPELPQWDGQIYVTRVCARALATHWKDSEEDDSLDERAAFVALVTSDKEGSRIFQDEDVLWLSTTPFLMPLVERLYWAGRQHNGLTEENRTAWRKKLRKHGRRWFAFLLCRTARTGFGLDVDRLLSEMPLALFEEWRALYEMEPWGDERMDWAAGTAIAHHVAAQGVNPKQPREYMPFLKKEIKKPQHEEDMKKTWEAICRAMADREQRKLT